MRLSHFKLSVAIGLIKAESRTTAEEVDPSAELPADSATVKQRPPAKASSVSADVRYDNFSYFLRQQASTAQRCEMSNCRCKTTYPWESVKCTCALTPKVIVFSFSFQCMHHYRQCHCYQRCHINCTPSVV